jgi:hypothetical protein
MLNDIQFYAVLTLAYTVYAVQTYWPTLILFGACFLTGYMLG